MKLLLDKLLRYLGAAIIAFAVDFGGLIFLTEMVKIHYIVAGTTSFVAGVFISFALTRRFVFSDPKYSRRKEFVGTLAIGTVGLLINNILLWMLTEKFGMFYLFSKLFATGVVFFWNFFMRKKFFYEG